MDAQAIDNVVQDLVNRELTVQTRILEVRDCDKSLKEMTTIHQRAKVELNRLNTAIEELELLAEEQDRSQDTDRLLKVASRHRKEHLHLTAELRRALLVYKKNAEKRSASEREQLLGSTEELERRRKEQARKSVAETNERLTAVLRQTREVMSKELQRNATTMKVLETSSSTLKSTVKEYKGFNASVRTTRGIMNHLKRRDVADKLLIGLGVALFLLVVIYILQARLWGRSAKAA